MLSIVEPGQYHFCNDWGDTITLKVDSDKNYLEMKGHDSLSFEMRIGGDEFYRDTDVLWIISEKQTEIFGNGPVIQCGKGPVKLDTRDVAKVSFGRQCKATYDQETGELVLEITKSTKKIIILTPPASGQEHDTKIEMDFTDDPNSPTVKKDGGPGSVVGRENTGTPDEEGLPKKTSHMRCSDLLGDIEKSLPSNIKTKAKENTGLLNKLMKTVAASLGLKLGTEEELINFLALLKFFYKK